MIEVKIDSFQMVNDILTKEMISLSEIKQSIKEAKEFREVFEEKIESFSIDYEEYIDKLGKFLRKIAKPIVSSNIDWSKIKENIVIDIVPDDYANFMLMCGGSKIIDVTSDSLGCIEKLIINKEYKDVVYYNRTQEEYYPYTIRRVQKGKSLSTAIRRDWLQPEWLLFIIWKIMNYFYPSTKKRYSKLIKIGGKWLLAGIGEGEFSNDSFEVLSVVDNKQKTTPITFQIYKNVEGFKAKKHSYNEYYRTHAKVGYSMSFHVNFNHIFSKLKFDRYDDIDSAISDMIEKIISERILKDNKKEIETAVEKYFKKIKLQKNYMNKTFKQDYSKLHDLFLDVFVLGELGGGAI